MRSPPRSSAFSTSPTRRAERRGRRSRRSLSTMWPLRLPSRLAALLALTPAIAVFCVVYVGATGWTIWISFTGSRMLPSSVFVGLRQYEQLYANERWLVSVHNLIIFGVLFVAVSIALGFVLAVAIDQKVRAENLLRSVYL